MCAVYRDGRFGQQRADHNEILGWARQVRAKAPGLKKGVPLRRAVANLLRLADSDLKDAELLSSGRNPGNAPALVRLSMERLVGAVAATETGWPASSSGHDADLIPDDNPLKSILLSLNNRKPSPEPPQLLRDGSVPPCPNREKLRDGILAARALLNDLVARFKVDLLNDQIAGRAAPIRPAPKPSPKPPNRHRSNGGHRRRSYQPERSDRKQSGRRRRRCVLRSLLRRSSRHLASTLPCSRGLPTLPDASVSRRPPPRRASPRPRSGL